MPEFQTIVLGTPGWHVQADVAKSSSARGGDCWTVRLAGTRAEIVALERRFLPGVTTYPDAAADFFGDADVRLDAFDMRGLDGDLAELVLRYVRRNAREGDVGAGGLLSRDVQFMPYERMESLEHFAARKGAGFDLALLDAWRQEPDPALKAAFKVATEGGTVTALSGLTLRAAQRLALGVEQVSRQQAQVVVEELYGARPEGVDLTPNVIMRNGLPANHAPDFGASGGRYHWMRKSVAVETPAPCRWLVRYVYVGVPAAFMPDPAPDDWGEMAFDAMLYGESQ